LHPERGEVAGGALLAVTHLSHLEPVVMMAQMSRPVYFMARVEFFPRWWGRLFFLRCGAFPVDRYGFSLPAVRRAIRLVGEGKMVGIFPEGGVATGKDSMVRGGAMKQGVCTISIRTGAPIIPVVLLGTEKLNIVWPWLPFRRGRVWIGFGRPVLPPDGKKSNRMSRGELAERLGREFVDVYQEMLREYGLRDEDVP
jgi:1-acyl-sn-glycerol-3-phosphate acyltransferase